MSLTIRTAQPGEAGGEVWAVATLSQSGESRPALIDPKTLAVKVLPIANIKPKESCSCREILGADADHGRRIH